MQRVKTDKPGSKTPAWKACLRVRRPEAVRQINRPGAGLKRERGRALPAGRERPCAAHRRPAQTEEAPCRQSQTVKREELFRITSESMCEQKPGRHRALALCLLSLGLVLTLMMTTVSIRVTYVTDSNGAKQLLLTSESDPTPLLTLSGIEAEEGDRVYYTAFGDSLATLNIERAFTVTIEADGQETPVKMVYGTVAEALEKAGITLGPDDYTVPALD